MPKPLEPPGNPVIYPDTAPTERSAALKVPTDDETLQEHVVDAQRAMLLALNSCAVLLSECSV